MQENKYKKHSRAPLAAVICTLLLIIICAFAYFLRNHPLSDGKIANLSVHYIDVGQGDATFIACGGETMLIDAGPTDSAELIINYIKSLGYSSLTYAVATHPDEDHIGALDEIIKNIDTKYLLKTSVENETYAYQGLIDASSSKKVQIITPQPGDEFSLGTSSFKILGPANITDDTALNDTSLILRLTYEQTSFFFAGDAQEKEELDLIKRNPADISSNVYKVSHHGSYSSSSEELLNVLKPDYCVISCGADNDYGHPHDVTLKRLYATGAKILRTDTNGNIIFYSDGRSVWFSASV